jgi:hypothetical protein
MGNYVIGVGNYVIATPSELGNYKIADSPGVRQQSGWGEEWASHPDSGQAEEAPGNARNGEQTRALRW